MKKRIAWLVVSSLMVLSLVLASCAPKVTEEKKAVTEEKKVVAEEKKAVAEEKKVVTEEKGLLPYQKAVPKYGGWLNVLVTAGATAGWGFSTLTATTQKWYIGATNEKLKAIDRQKGPAGTGEWAGIDRMTPPVSQYIGNVAESWEIDHAGSRLIYKIRKGIHWQDKAPVYGAELTAGDVVYSLITFYTHPRNVYVRSYSFIRTPQNPAQSFYVDPDDPWKVIVEAIPENLSTAWEQYSYKMVIFPKALGPPENDGFKTWRGVVGTGPFMLTDYVTDSSFTWVRNPNYWRDDQLYPGNRLPYLDGVRVLVIPDVSTQMAALRTGKIDMLGEEEFDGDEWQTLMKSNPELRWVNRYEYQAFGMRNDVKPFDNVKVRQAMMMAIDHDELVRDYYGGEAIKFYFPVYPVAEQAEMWIPLEKMPEVVQLMFGYHPDKARQILAEAGYPKGFTTSVTISNIMEREIDLLSVVKNYWAKVGVTLEIDVKDNAVFTAMTNAFSYPNGRWGGPGDTNQPYRFSLYRAVATTNYVRANDPLVEETYKKVMEVLHWDWPKHARIIKEAAPELASRAFYQILPAPYVYNIWQPWLKGYYGENFVEGHLKFRMVWPWVWIDQDLKQEMTGRR